MVGGESPSVWQKGDCDDSTHAVVFFSEGKPARCQTWFEHSQRYRKVSKVNYQSGDYTTLSFPDYWSHSLSVRIFTFPLQSVIKPSRKATFFAILLVLCYSSHENISPSYTPPPQSILIYNYINLQPHRLPVPLIHLVAAARKRWNPRIRKG